MGDDLRIRRDFAFKQNVPARDEGPRSASIWDANRVRMIEPPPAASADQVTHESKEV
jgi:hypothetical protein